MKTDNQTHQTGLEGLMKMQQSVLESFSGMNGVQEMARPLVRQSASMGEEMVDYALEAQLGATHAWVQAVQAMDTGNGAMAQASTEFESVAREWIKVRRELWHGFFDGMRSISGDASSR